MALGDRPAPAPGPGVLAAAEAVTDCEIGTGSLAQPVNAVSAIAYVAVGIAILIVTGRRRAGRDGPVLAAAAVATGVGSIAVHGWPNRWTEAAHDLGLVVLVTTMAAGSVLPALALHRDGRRGTPSMAAVAAGVVVAAALLEVVDASATVPLVALVVGIGALSELVCRRHGARGAWSAPMLVALGTGTTLWWLGHPGPRCANPRASSSPMPPGTSCRRWSCWPGRAEPTSSEAIRCGRERTPGRSWDPVTLTGLGPVTGGARDSRGGRPTRHLDVARPMPRPASPLRELTAVPELAAFWASSPLLAMAPRGRGHRVLVIPGFTAGDLTTAPLRLALRALGHRPAGWGLGANIGPDDLTVRGLMRRLDRLVARNRGPIDIVGWSLGGIMGRLLAIHRPEDIRQVISLGSPIRVVDPEANLSQSVRRIAQLAGLRRGSSLYDLTTVPVPSTAVFSRGDGVVAPSAARQDAAPGAESVEVRGSHMGLATNPSVVWLVADRLAWHEGPWTPFEPPSRFAWMYPTIDAGVPTATGPPPPDVPVPPDVPAPPEAVVPADGLIDADAGAARGDAGAPPAAATSTGG